MITNLEVFKKMLIGKEKTLLDALLKINDNSKGIVFITDDLEKLCGILTDGDIRRFLIQGYSLSEKIEQFTNREFVYGRIDESQDQIRAKLTPIILIIPIVDGDFKVVDYFEAPHSNTVQVSAPSLKGREFNYLVDAFLSTWVSSSGKYIDLFEKKFATYSNSEYAVSTSNGTSALHLALLESGVGNNDEVIVPTVTFIAPVNTIKYVNADPVFIDCDDHLNIDVGKVKEFFEKECSFNGESTVDKKTGKKVAAIIPVHIFGHPVDLDSLIPLAKKFHVKVIEDASQALGSYYKKGTYKGRKVGEIGDFGCFSFNGNKIITSGGGGMVVTPDEKNARHIKYLSTQAKDDGIFYIHDEIGYNYRMTNLHAAMGLAQLENIEANVKVKRKNFNIYKDALTHFKGLYFIEEPDYAVSNYWFYSLVVDKESYGLSRDDLMYKLEDNGIQARPLWYLNHWQKQFKNNRHYKIEKASWYYDRVLNIPCSVDLKTHEIEKVISIIKGN